LQVKFLNKRKGWLLDDNQRCAHCLQEQGHDDLIDLMLNMFFGCHNNNSSTSSI